MAAADGRILELAFLCGLKMSSVVPASTLTTEYVASVPTLALLSSQPLNVERLLPASEKLCTSRPSNEKSEHTSKVTLRDFASPTMLLVNEKLCRRLGAWTASSKRRSLVTPLDLRRSLCRAFWRERRLLVSYSGSAIASEIGWSKRRGQASVVGDAGFSVTTFVLAPRDERAVGAGDGFKGDSAGKLGFGDLRTTLFGVALTLKDR